MPDHLIIDDKSKQLSHKENQFVSDVLSDLALAINENSQMATVVYQSDEWLLADVTTESGDFEFNMFRKQNGTRKWIKTDDDLEIHRSGFKVYLKVKRHTGYYVSNLIVPLLIVVLCGLFTIFLPGHSDARLNLAVTVLLGFIFVQTIIASITPKSEDNPLISQYVTWSLILSMISLAASAVCVGIGQLSENSTPPKGLRLISYHMLHLIKHRIQRLRAPKASSTIGRTKAELRTATDEVPQSAIIEQIGGSIENIKAEKCNSMLYKFILLLKFGI